MYANFLSLFIHYTKIKCFMSKTWPSPMFIEDYRESKKTGANFLGSRSLNFVDKPETERAISAGALQENQ